MIDIIIATRNRHKFRELQVLLKVAGVRFHSLQDYSHLPTIPEHGRTFAANAITKARAVARATGYPAIADDSGLEVDALASAPGVRSARFAGQHGDDEANNRKLLQVLNGLPRSRRRARYRCVLALASPRRLLGVTEGVFAGVIAAAPKGTRGFGYDPLFLVPRLGKTVGQLPASVKQRLSHRAKAAKRMRVLLVRFVHTACLAPSLCLPPKGVAGPCRSCLPRASYPLGQRGGG